MDTATLIAALRRPDAYRHPVAGAVELVQTHISLLFFAGPFVYKVKKSVDLGFLDFRSLADRRHFCEEEVRLNRRLAPAVYLGVSRIARDESGRVAVDGEGTIVDYAVRMTRLPASGMLDRRLDRGEIDNGQLDRIVETMAAFHRVAPTGPGVDEHADPEALAAQMEDNLAGLARFAAVPGEPAESGVRVLTPTRLAFLRDRVRRSVREERPLLLQRIAEGRIREGHGDLHSGNVCFVDDGVVVYDCIEFSRAFRCRDVACEIAFLAMDLDYRGYRGFARYFAGRYAERTGDSELSRLVDLYKIHLAAVRGKIAAIRVAEAALRGADAAPEEEEVVEEEKRVAARREARRHLDLAAAYALSPCLVLTCGLPASGKSVAARAIARPFGSVVLRSDVVRKELARIAPTRSAAAPPAGGIYTTRFTERTYDELHDRTAALLRRGRSVVVDATFPTAGDRRRFHALAASAGARVLVVEMRCDEATTRRRLAARARDANEVSDADWDVYVHARTRFEPPTPSAGEPHVLVEGDADAETVSETVIDALIAAST